MLFPISATRTAGTETLVKLNEEKAAPYESVSVRTLDGVRRRLAKEGWSNKPCPLQ